MAGRTEQEYRQLAGKKFNALLAADPELKRLENLKYDRKRETAVLMEVLGMAGTYRIGKLPCLPITAAKWAFLWMLGSPFVSGGTVNSADLDLVLFVLCEPDLRRIPAGVHELPGLASGYGKAAGLTPEELIGEIRSLISTAFQPLSMLPGQTVSGEPETFDAAWVTWIAGLAAKESNLTLEECLHKISLSTVCTLFVNWFRREGKEGDQVRRRPAPEIEAKIEARVEELADKFLKH